MSNEFAGCLQGDASGSSATEARGERQETTTQDGHQTRPTLGKYADRQDRAKDWPDKPFACRKQSLSVGGCQLEQVVMLVAAIDTLIERRVSIQLIGGEVEAAIGREGEAIRPAQTLVILGDHRHALRR